MNPRKRPSRAQRERIYQRSGGACQRCGEPIGIDAFHVAHLRSHVHGGALVDENLEAWCLPCNLRQGAEDVRDTRTSPRAWQVEALNRVIARITRDGAATVSAAPGAGKTIFAGLVFEALYDADVVDRMVVLAPRLTLISQWHAALRAHRHIELKPGAEVERPGQSGVIVTYQSLNVDTVGVHSRQAELQRTLLVLDEVHHVGESHRDGSRPAWARNVAEFAGEVDGDLHVAGVLNLSGTLWRISTLDRPGRTVPNQRISTVRYRPALDKYGRPIPNKIESEVDAEVTAERLIREGQLRPIDLHRINGRVEMFETAKFELVQSDMADLDEEPARATLRELAAQSPWRQRFVAKVLAQLQAAHTALNGHPVKALIVAATQDDARLFADEVDQQMRELHLSPLAEIAISDEPEAAVTLERFRRSNRVGVLCCVDMAGEGYDCPDIAVVGYATNKLTHLYVMQVIARAMRVTDAERQMGQVIPAAIVVPEVKALIDTLEKYLAPISHEIMLEQQTAQREREGKEDNGTGAPRLVDQPYIIESVIPTDERITIPLADGESATFTVEQLAGVESYFERYNLPTVFYPRALASMADYLGDEAQRNPFDPRITNARDRVTTREQMSDEQICKQKEAELVHLERWWAKNGDGTVARFAGRANAEAGIGKGMRGRASAKQLTVALQFERDQVARYCEVNNLPLPRRMKGGDNV
jgi:superfamily II DNA or RNA helicase